MKLDLETLKNIKQTFDLYNDHSSQCDGYNYIVNQIKFIEQDKEKRYTGEDMINFCNYCVRLAYNQGFTDITLGNLLQKFIKTYKPEKE